MVISIYGMPPLSLVIYTLAGGTLLAISANVMNQVLEVETDKLMERTSDRPIVTGELTKTNGIIYSISSGLIGFLILYSLVTPLSSFIGLAANIFYVFIYTLILKPRTNFEAKNKSKYCHWRRIGSSPRINWLDRNRFRTGDRTLGLIPFGFYVDTRTFLGIVN